MGAIGSQWAGTATAGLQQHVCRQHPSRRPRPRPLPSPASPFPVPHLVVVAVVVAVLRRLVARQHQRQRAPDVEVNLPHTARDMGTHMEARGLGMQSGQEMCITVRCCTKNLGCYNIEGSGKVPLMQPHGPAGTAVIGGR